MGPLSMQTAPEIHPLSPIPLKSSAESLECKAAHTHLSLKITVNPLCAPVTLLGIYKKVKTET